MKRLGRILTLLLTLTLLISAPLAYGQTSPARRPLGPRPGLAFEPGRVLVQYAPGASSGVRAAALAESSAAPVVEVASDLTLVTVPGGDELAAAERLRAQPGVLAAAPNYRVYEASAPNDPFLSRQWHHPLLNAPDAWDLAVGSNAVTVAVLDSGVDLAHPDLAARIILGRDFVDSPNDNEPRDGRGHGTHVAGLLGATTDNFVGVAGADWQARLLIVRVLDDNGSGYLDDIVAGIDYAIAQGADVINLSLGSYEAVAATILQPAIDRAHAAGVVVVAAMGNSGVSTPFYPAACDHVIAVAATTRTDVYAYYSNYGPYVDLAAPGGQWASSLPDANGIYSTMPTYMVTANSDHGLDRNYAYWQGTSMAAPLVSGLAALLLAVDPTLTPAQVESLMESTAQDLGPTGWDQDYGWGRIDFVRAVGQIAPPPRAQDLTITALTEAGPSLRNVALAWTPPLQAHSVTIRRSTAPITAANWDSATVVASGLGPSTTTYIASNVPYSGGALYFALRADGQYAPGTLWSAVSNNAFWPVKRQVLVPIMMR